MRNIRPPRGVSVTVEAPLRWIAPSWIRPGASTPRHRFVLRAAEFADTRTIEVAQGEHVLWHGTIVSSGLVPNRSLSIDAGWAEGVDPEGPPVVLMPFLRLRSIDSANPWSKSLSA